MKYIILLLNNVFAFFDRLIGWAIAEVYELIMKVSLSQVLDSKVVEQFSGRIGILLSLFMLFWLAFRMIKYAINPEMTTDSGQGFGKIIANTVIMLTMLALVNFAFTFAMDFQSTVLKSNVLLKAVFGVSDETGNPIGDGDDVGHEMAYYLFAAFISPSDMLVKCKNFYGLEGQALTDCVKLIEDRSSYTVRNDWVEGNNNKDVSYLLSSSVVSAAEGDDYLFKYVPVISTVCGLVMLVLVISVAVDVAVRVVKLAFLQIIAPIPIISYIDPASGENGIFKKWLKMVGSTYVSLFIKLLMIYFAVFFISYFAKGNVTLDGNKVVTLQSEPFVIVLLMIGTLMFAKKLPSILSEIFGVDLDGGSFGSIAKGFKRAGRFAGGVALGAGAAVGAGVLGGLGAGASNAAHAFRSNHDLKKAHTNDGVLDKKAYKADQNRMSFWRGAGSTIAGFGSGAARGAAHSATSKDGILASAGAGMQGSATARNTRDTYQKAGYNVGDRIKDAFDESIGYQNKFGGYGGMDQKIHDAESTVAGLVGKEEQFRDYAAGVAKNDTTYTLSDYEKYYEEFKSSGSTSAKTYFSTGDYGRGENNKEPAKSVNSSVIAYVEASAEADRIHDIDIPKAKGELNKQKDAYTNRQNGTGHRHGGK